MIVSQSTGVVSETQPINEHHAVDTKSRHSDLGQPAMLSTHRNSSNRWGLLMLPILQMPPDPKIMFLEFEMLNI
jgi:hypothetical protein